MCVCLCVFVRACVCVCVREREREREREISKTDRLTDRQAQRQSQRNSRQIIILRITLLIVPFGSVLMSEQMIGKEDLPYNGDHQKLRFLFIYFYLPPCS